MNYVNYVLVDDLEHVSDENYGSLKFSIGNDKNGKFLAYRLETPYFCFEGETKEDVIDTAEKTLEFYMQKRTNFEMVAEFHRVFGVPMTDKVRTAENDPDWTDEAKFRYKLIVEELTEMVDAIEDKDTVALADVLADLLYFIYGTGQTFGIDLDKCFKEVHDSNMTKLFDGKPKYREDGKILKGPNFREPDLKKILDI